MVYIISHSAPPVFYPVAAACALLAWLCYNPKLYDNITYYTILYNIM